MLTAPDQNENSLSLLPLDGPAIAGPISADEKSVLIGRAPGRDSRYRCWLPIGTKRRISTS